MDKKDYSLYKLLEEYRVCIPVIQRDYIQGLEEENIMSTRQRMIEDIKVSLQSRKRLSLNIVYGLHEDESTTFYPVDGQQRLTFLYLLHWYLALRSTEGEFERFCELKPFFYETRNYANEFFSFLRDKENKEKWLNIFKSSDRHKLTLLERVKMKSWFKSQWLTDTTVISIINVFGDFVDNPRTKIDVSKVEEYYEQLKTSTVICFDFLSESVRDAENTASTNYIRLNARGKQLDDFENVKAILSMLENKIGKEDIDSQDFVSQYDQKYIDIFYKECSEEKSLEEKTKKINGKTLRLLMNTYTLLWSIRGETKYENATFHDYYSTIYTKSQKDEISKFWIEYFEFLNILLTTIAGDDGIKKRITLFWEQIYEPKTKDSDNLVSSLLYVYYYYKSQQQYANINNIEQLDYVLLNLKYKEWKQVGFRTIELLAQYSAEYLDVFEFFAQEKPDRVIAKLKVHKDNGEINELYDIKVRFKEQCIKANIICRLKEDYTLFESLEKKSGIRKIQYLLSISDMWVNEITQTKIDVLLRYMEVAEWFLYNKTEQLLWKKLFAVASYWDVNNNCLLTKDMINQQISAKNASGKRNIHYWNDEHYFINDDIERKNKEDHKLREEKHTLIKSVYDIWIAYGLSDEQQRKVWLKNQFADSAYEACWLKYAVDRNRPELLDNTVSYDEVQGKVYIDIKHNYRYHKWDEKDKWRYNFFSTVYMFDFLENQPEYKHNMYDSSVWDYYGRPFSATSIENGVQFYSNLKIINQFGLRLLWGEDKQKDLSYQFGEQTGIVRGVFGCMHSIDFPYEPNSSITVTHKEVVITEFIHENQYKQHLYNLDNSREMSDIKNKIQDFDVKVDGYKNIEDADLAIWDRRSYTYNYEEVFRHKYKGSSITQIKKESFVDLETIQFIKCTHLLK
ncbi:DUF262 domain-containing protein [Paenibacillus sp. D2_2]|uniref:DUF262 domain-containing protein n=1 Tax=Paenibacillus sp. D2_2 TaxID=3073092 RepID=UPI002815807C|nr:DUF262 domain-containing protein [Paenibacillus sp. D2_2]WMT41750.1 DUF262 domain-containing protein [Paenibacillus sp. D2_2]